MIPATPGGILKKILKEKARIANLRINVVEKPGMKLSSHLKKYEKTANKENCGKNDCMICKNSNQGKKKCRIPNIVYRITCEECEKSKISANYYGETSFNGYTRGLQHQQKYRSKSLKTQEKSAMRKHAKEIHGDKNVKYKMEVIKTFKNNPLARQVYESIQIVNSKAQDMYPLNDKNEFNQAMIITAKYTKGVF